MRDALRRLRERLHGVPPRRARLVRRGGIVPSYARDDDSEHVLVWIGERGPETVPFLPRQDRP